MILVCEEPFRLCFLVSTKNRALLNPQKARKLGMSMRVVCALPTIIINKKIVYYSSLLEKKKKKIIIIIIISSSSSSGLGVFVF